jgi:hypothetical protein
MSTGDTMDENKKKALTAALMQIEKQFGKGLCHAYGGCRYSQ